jgi:hypothetical protein
MKAQTIPATQFKAELWTTANSSEIWAVVMLDGSEPGAPCAFGPKQKMEAYAAQLNESKGPAIIKGYEITCRARRFKYRRALATVFFTSKRAAERYAREHFTASEQARVRILSGK